MVCWVSWVSGFLPRIWGGLAFKKQCLHFAQKLRSPEVTLERNIALHQPHQLVERQEAQHSFANCPLILLSHPWFAVWIPASLPPELLLHFPSQALLPPASQPLHSTLLASTWIMCGIPLVVLPRPSRFTGTETFCRRRKSLEILGEVPLAECC